MPGPTGAVLRRQLQLEESKSEKTLEEYEAIQMVLQLKDYEQPLEKVSFDKDNEKISLITNPGDAYNFDEITKMFAKN